MKDKKTLSKITLALAVSLLLLEAYWYFVPKNPVEQRQDVVSYLEHRFKQQNIPVKEITIINQEPLQIEITVQSLSDGEVGTPDDSTNVLMVSREITLANQNGYHIETLVINLVNQAGVSLYKEWGPLNNETMSSVETFDPSNPVLSDEATKDLIAKKLNLYGLTLTSIEVNAFDGIRTVTLKLSTGSRDEGSYSLAGFIPYLYVVIPDVNGQGAHIGLCKVELRGKDDELLFNYTYDVQTGEESWWHAEGFVADW